MYRPLIPCPFISQWMFKLFHMLAAVTSAEGMLEYPQRILLDLMVVVASVF